MVNFSATARLLSLLLLLLSNQVALVEAQTNIALGKPTAQIDDYQSLFAKNAVDGSTGSFTHTTSKANTWWYVQVAGPSHTCTVNSVTIINRPDCCQARLVGASVELWNGVPGGGGTMITSAGSMSSAMSQSVSFSAVIGVRYVRIFKPANDELQLAEVQVDGTCTSDPNIALSKPTVQSSTYSESGGSGSSNKAVDGNTNGNFLNGAGSVAHTLNGSIEWWQVALSSNSDTCSVNQITVWNRMDGSTQRMYGVTLELWDGNPQTGGGSILASVNPLEGIETQTRFFTTTGVRYVRLVEYGDNLQLAEVQVFGTCAPTTNIALGKTTSQTSNWVESGITCSSNKAVDGNTNGVATSGSVAITNNAANNWWQVELVGASMTCSINQVTVWNRSGANSSPERMTGVMVQLWDGNPQAGGTMLTSAGPLANLVSQTISFTTTGVRYVRLFKSSADYLQMAEVQVYGACMAVPTPAPTPLPTTAQPTPFPTPLPTAQPTPFPTPKPSAQPSSQPSSEPSSQPSVSPPPSVGAGGDPHFKLFSGLSFDFHGHCDLLLLDTTLADGAHLVIHVRSSPFKKIFSYISEAAVRIGDHVLTIGSGGQHAIDGVPQVVGKTGALVVDESHQYPIQSSKAHNKPRHVYKIHLGNGPHGKQEIDIREYKNWITVTILHPSASNLERSKGLLGRFPDGALLGKDGKTIHTSYDDFGQDWQVPPSDSLLGPGPFLDSSCAPLEALKNRRHRRLEESSITRSQAREVCQHWGNQMEDCINDVLVSGDLEMADAGPL